MSTPHLQQTIRNFSSKTAPGVFPHIKRKEVAAGLSDRVEYPTDIDQGPTSLCGSAVFLYTVAKQSPAIYLKYVTDLFDSGRAAIGDLKIVPGKGCKNYNPIGDRAESVAGPSAISPCDWVGLASLRDSENSLFNYDHHSDQFSGITLPSHLVSWFQKAGFNSVEERTNLAFDKGLENLLEANRNM